MFRQSIGDSELVRAALGSSLLLLLLPACGKNVMRVELDPATRQVVAFEMRGSFSGSGCMTSSYQDGEFNSTLSQHGASDWAEVASFKFLASIAGQVFGAQDTAEQGDPVYGPGCRQLFETAEEEREEGLEEQLEAVEESSE